MENWTEALGKIDQVENLNFQIVTVLFIFTSLYVWKKELGSLE